MANYTIDARETVFYRVTVDAESENAARDLVMSGAVDITKHVIDSEGFAIEEVYPTPQ